MRSLFQTNTNAPWCLDVLNQPLPPSEHEWKKFDVVASTVAWSDYSHFSTTIYPRVPGNIIFARDESGAVFFCSGFLPCGSCASCRAALHLSCIAPIIPGSNAQGGIAEQVALPIAYLCPEISEANVNIVELIVCIAACGPAYQAMASVGMIPGDAVVIIGDPDPLGIVSRLFHTSGLRPVWVTRRRFENIALHTRTDVPSIDELPTIRYHILQAGKPFLDEIPDYQSRFASLIASAQSLTFIPSAFEEARPPSNVSELLHGDLTVRRIHHLHPHLVLDLAGLVSSKRLTLENCVEKVSFDAAREKISDWKAERASRWPVILVAEF